MKRKITTAQYEAAYDLLQTESERLKITKLGKIAEMIMTVHNFPTTDAVAIMVIAIGHELEEKQVTNVTKIKEALCTVMGFWGQHGVKLR